VVKHAVRFARLARLLFLLFCFNLSGSAHLLAHAEAAFGDGAVAGEHPTNDVEDDDEDCPPGCPTCCHCAHAGTVPLGAATSPTSTPPSRDVASVAAEYGDGAPREAVLGSVFRPPRA